MNIFEKWREPVSTLTHLIALICIIPIMFILVYKSYFIGGALYVFTFSIFAFSIISLYTASTIYHMLKVNDKAIKLLKKIDHMMIFVLIAGTYTPICIISLHNKFGYYLLLVIWSIAILGILLKTFWANVPRFISTSLYVIMGWISVIAFSPIRKSMAFNGILLLILGGVIYTVGAIIYVTKKPNFTLKFFGFHEIFHIFVIGGSLCHIILMFKYVL